METDITARTDTRPGRGESVIVEVDPPPYDNENLFWISPTVARKLASELLRAANVVEDRAMEQNVLEQNCSCTHGSMGGPCSLCGHDHPIRRACAEWFRERKELRAAEAKENIK